MHNHEAKKKPPEGGVKLKQRVVLGGGDDSAAEVGEDRDCDQQQIELNGEVEGGSTGEVALGDQRLDVEPN
jgi:hypothetical protein